jgi:hypothetical protein
MPLYPLKSLHFSGSLEAAVKSFKYQIIYVAESALLTCEAFMTYIVEIKAIFSSCLLKPLFSDPNFLGILTPGHFLIGEALTTIPEHESTAL